MKSLPRPALLLALCAAVVFTAYLPSLHAPFTFDDIRNITDNPSLRMTEFDLDSVARALTPHADLDPRRPVANLSFALNYRLGGGAPLGYHLFNLGILLLCLPAAFWLVSLLAGTWLPRRLVPAAALGVVALWALNPLLTSAVTYVVQRMTSLCALFSLLALASFVKGRATGRRGWYAMALVFLLPALGAKETALLVPFLALLYLWLSAPDGPTGRRLGWALAGAVVLSQAALVGYAHLSGLGADRSYTLVERGLTEGRVVLRYLSLFLLPLPSRLNLDYSFALSTSLISPPATLAALVVHGALVGAAVGLRRRMPLFSFGILSFYLLQLLESTFLPIAIIFEHRAFLPSLFLSLAVVDLLLTLSGARRSGKIPALLAAAVAAVSLGWGALTWQRNTVWSDQVRLWGDVAAKSPDSARAHINLGVALLGEGDAEKAAYHFRETLRLSPGRAEAHNNLANALLQMKDRPAAEKHLREALRLDPELPTAHNNLANLLLRRRELDRAAEHYREAVRLKPWYAEARHNLGVALSGLGRTEEAIEQYRLALELDPGSAAIHYSLGVALAREARLGEAAERFAESLRLDGSRAEAHYNLGVIHTRSGRREEALDAFREALRLRPDYPEAEYNVRVLSAAPRPPGGGTDPPAGAP
jgi:tetratricopeptide (TPR) repeat protein